MKNALSIYLEGWHHRNDRCVTWREMGEGMREIPRQTEGVLKLLRHYSQKATFFVLGEVADQFPSLVKRIHAEGHEIASHGYYHRLVYRMSPAQFREDLRSSLCSLEDLTGEKVKGYSAPSWSLTSKMRWAFDLLEKEGVQYDASLFPMKTFLYGENRLPRFPYRIPGTNLIEFPPSTVRWLGRNWPFSGGFYLRMLPGRVIHGCLQWINRREGPASIYLHPWELDCSQTYLPLLKRDAWIPFGNVGKTEEKVLFLLKEFKFSSVRDVLTTVEGVGVGA